MSQLYRTYTLHYVEIYIQKEVQTTSFVNQLHKRDIRIKIE